LPGFDIAATAYPTDETGGDYFDFIPQSDGSLY
jgi:serine phosphatase RsbU (regulator of sigma subunit)